MNVFTEKSGIREENKDLQLNSPALYHKILDYHVTEILLATVAIGTLVFFRLHR